MTTIVVIMILGLMVVSSYTAIKEKAARGACTSNLKGLYAAGTAYLTDQGSWPQIESSDPEDSQFALQWIQAFSGYGVAPKIWICPTVNDLLGKPEIDWTKPRLDYLPTSFDPGPNIPNLYPTHPWFIERADAHGKGNLIILANGQVYALKDLIIKKK